MFTPGHEYFEAILVAPWYAIGGDHTRTAVTNLSMKFPGMDPNVKILKQPKQVQKMGKINAQEILGPTDSIRARE